MFHDILAHGALIHTRIFVRLQVRKRLLGEAFRLSHSYTPNISIHHPIPPGTRGTPPTAGRQYIRLLILPMILPLSPLVGVVTGSGSARFAEV